MNARNMWISTLVVIVVLLSGCGAPATPPSVPTSTLTQTPEVVPTLTFTPSPEPTQTSTVAPESALVQLEGSVVWASDNEPIPDFSVELGGTNEVKATTDADGIYFLTDLKPGKYPLSLVWEMDKSGKPLPCQSFQISFPSSIISGTAISLSATNPTGRVFLAVGYEIDLSSGGVVTVDFQVECN
jgi:hypothetical protein